MATDVVMPQMGESIAEGTVVRWIKKVGDKVERDEPLLEISTDKVDAEIPAPASGTLSEIVAQEGQTVAVNAAVARIATDGEAEAPAPAPAETPRPAATPQPQFKPGERDRIEPLSVMRKSIAKHMVLSKQTSAHVTTVFEVDFTNIEKLRRQYKDIYAERGVKLTYLPFIVQAVIAGLRDFPIINASMDENNIVYHRDLNIGIAVALEWGLIVPVVKRADEKNILGLSRAINDLGERARTKKLSPDEVQGGTFTITNPGIYGGLFGTPIINQPQVAILGVGGVKKRPVVIETKEGDSIAIRSMCYLALTFDHRLVDGAVADQFMARVRQLIESGQFTM